MFDLRYHVVSLAAVFIALVIGILVGVGITTQGVISTSERKVLNVRIAELTRQRDAARNQAREVAGSQRLAQAFVKRTYPALMAGRLATTRIGLIFVGSVDGGLRSEINATLADADSSGPIRLRALKVPFDIQAIDTILEARRLLTRYAGPGHLGDLGRALADEFVLGGKTPLWNALTQQLVEERSGSDAAPLDAVVIVRSAAPQAGPTAKLLAGIYSGLAVLGGPAVGVEDADEAVSAVATYRKHSLSSVDDLNTAAGRLSLAVLLANGQPGNYGVKQSADDFLPPVDPVQTGG